MGCIFDATSADGLKTGRLAFGSLLAELPLIRFDSSA
jgi:hypothetical protein